MEEEIAAQGNLVIPGDIKESNFMGVSGGPVPWAKLGYDVPKENLKVVVIFKKFWFIRYASRQWRDCKYIYFQKGKLLKLTTNSGVDVYIPNIDKYQVIVYPQE